MSDHEATDAPASSDGPTRRDVIAYGTAAASAAGLAGWTGLLLGCHGQTAGATTDIQHLFSRLHPGQGNRRFPHGLFFAKRHQINNPVIEGSPAYCFAFCFQCGPIVVAGCVMWMFMHFVLLIPGHLFSFYRL
jgi:hypothetical protein